MVAGSPNRSAEEVVAPATADGLGHCAFCHSLPRRHVFEYAPPAPAGDGWVLRDVVMWVSERMDAADLLGVWLRRLGHAVHVARTGPDGVALVVEVQPDVVPCDIGLPGMDGTEVRRTVLAQMARPPLMVALTGWGMEHDRARTQAAGFQHHLVKPVAMEQLIELLRTAPALA